MDGKRKCETPFTVGETVYYSLQRPQQNQNWADAVKRDDLARAVHEAKDFPLPPDQRTMIETAVGSIPWAPAVIGAITKVIEPKP